MGRGWFGFGVLIVFLVLCFIAGIAMDNAHTPTEQLLQQAAEKTLSGDFDGGISLGLQAKSRWDRHWNGTATVADHSPMDEVDALFAEMEIYARAGEQPHFAACCKQLASRIHSFADVHRFIWWNML